MLTLQDCHALLAVYEDMARAAEANDWTRLAELELGSAGLRKLAQQRPSAPLQGDDGVAAAALIRRILELDTLIRSHAEPALASTRKLLSGSVRGRNLRDAYGSV